MKHLWNFMKRILQLPLSNINLPSMNENKYFQRKIFRKYFRMEMAERIWQDLFVP